MDPQTAMMLAQMMQSKLQQNKEANNKQPQYVQTQVLGGVPSPNIQPAQTQQPMSPMRQAGMGALQGYAQGGFGGAVIGASVPLIENYMNNRNQQRLQQQAPPQYYKPTAEDDSPFRRAMMQQLQTQGK